jgi:prophage regulatory protein
MQDARKDVKSPEELACEYGLSEARLADLRSQLMGPSAIQFREHPSPSRILRLPEVMKRVALSKTTIYDRIKKDEFPAQSKLLDGSTTAGWFEDEIEAYLAARRIAKPKMPHSAGISQAKPVSPTNAPTRPVPAIKDRVPKSTPFQKDECSKHEDMLIATSMQILGCQVFLHKTTGKLLLDIGLLSSSSLAPLLAGLDPNLAASPDRTS